MAQQLQITNNGRHWRVTFPDGKICLMGKKVVRTKTDVVKWFSKKN